MSDPTTYQRLAERFPAEEHKSRQQGGRDLTYVDGELVISRLNEVLGFDWSFRVVREGTTEIEAWVLGELTATIDGKAVTRQQYGNQDMKRGQHPTSDLFKSAATDALKKCATTIGVGLYLFNPDDRREVEAEMKAAKRRAPLPQGSAAAPRGASPTPSSGDGDSRSPSPLRPTTPDEKTAADALSTGAPPTTMKTKAELEADLQKGIEYARSIGLERAEQDTSRFTRADFEEVIDALRSQCRYVLAERKKQAAGA